MIEPVSTSTNVFGDEATTATLPGLVVMIMDGGNGRELTMRSAGRITLTGVPGNSVRQTTSAIAAKTPTTASPRLQWCIARRRRTARNVPSRNARSKSAGAASASTSSSRRRCSDSVFIDNKKVNHGWTRINTDKRDTDGAVRFHEHGCRSTLWKSVFIGVHPWFIFFHSLAGNPPALPEVTTSSLKLSQASHAGTTKPSYHLFRETFENCNRNCSSRQKR